MESSAKPTVTDASEPTLAGQLAEMMAAVDNLQAALDRRDRAIDQAIGILRARTGSGVDQAFAGLRRVSQSKNAKLASVAASIVQAAASRARARLNENG